MSLLRSILKRVESCPSFKSPPPDLKVVNQLKKMKRQRAKKKRLNYSEYKDIPAKVDSSPPFYNRRRDYMMVETWLGQLKRIATENYELLLLLRRAQFNRGRVDCHWRFPPKLTRVYHQRRVDNYKRIYRANKVIYDRIVTQGPKVTSTETFRRDWAKNRRIIVEQARGQFVLFPPIPTELIEDPAFIRPKGVRRPRYKASNLVPKIASTSRVFLSLQIRECAVMGELEVELFTDWCPETCRLFMDLLLGDGVGHSYVGTKFFRKVPQLYWAGGDVIYDNGFGCYMQKNRACPIGAENFHFSHSMPGLLSMSVTCDNEVCGRFNITFKPLPQFDLKNIVFGRIIRPSHLFDCISCIGGALSPQPEVIVSGTRMKRKGQWLHGAENTEMLPELTPRAFRKRIEQERQGR